MALSGSKEKGSKSASLKGQPFRIDHPRYFSDDECECSRCGVRFSVKSMVCPKCSMHFSATKEDDSKFIEEMEIWDGDED